MVRQLRMLLLLLLSEEGDGRVISLADILFACELSATLLIFKD